MATTIPRPAAETPQPLSQREAEGAAAEQRHALYDLDADSQYTLPGCSPMCPPRDTAGGAR